jgi:glycosyltransferase involved in cell wall biosynthesis
MKIHILPNPHNPTNTLNPIDPFTIAAWKYAKYLSPKYEVILYGLPGSQVDCELVTIDSNNDLYNFNYLAAIEISMRKSPGDIVACFYGFDNMGATLGLKNCIVIEPSIGYRASAVFADYRVFVSYAQMHMTYGEKGLLMSPHLYDEVIPNSFTVSDFTFNENKKDYFLYLGRVVEEKGVDLCIDLTKDLGIDLVIAGPIYQEKYNTFPPHVHYVGLVDQKMRNELMSNAKCILGPTLYVEPFGNMIIEANLCGTPAITSDWGGFAETVIDGKTGFRCRSYKQFLEAGENISKIKPIDCRNHGLNYSDEKIHDLHDKYIQRLLHGLLPLS